MSRPANSSPADTQPDIHTAASNAVGEAFGLLSITNEDLTHSINEIAIRTYDPFSSQTDRLTEYYWTLHDTDATSDGTGGKQVLRWYLEDAPICGKGKYARQRSRTRRRLNHLGMRPRAERVDFTNATPAEITALQLLRQLVGQDEFRRYLKYGFVMVRGGSGLRYQIGRNRHVIDVWNERGRVDGICVYLEGQYPPTDDTITRMLMAERDELELWRRGNSRAGRAATVADLERLYGTERAA